MCDGEGAMPNMEAVSEVGRATWVSAAGQGRGVDHRFNQYRCNFDIGRAEDDKFNQYDCCFYILRAAIHRLDQYASRF